MNEQCLAGNIQQKTIQKVFDQRSEFIIIGLTGSRKSKTSEIANILQSKFDELDLSSYHTALDYKSQKEYDMIPRSVWFQCAISLVIKGRRQQSLSISRLEGVARG